MNIDRILKILAAQTTSIDSVERKINGLSSKPKQNLRTIEEAKSDKKSQAPSIVPGGTVGGGTQDYDINRDMFETATLGNFPRIEDDHLSNSSEEEIKKRERMEVLSKLANQPKDYNLVQDYRLPILTAQADMQIDIQDSSD